MYEWVGELKLKDNVFSECDYIMVEFNEDERVLRVSLFDADSKFLNETYVRLTENQDGELITDKDIWQKRCLEIAAHVDELEAYVKELGRSQKSETSPT